MTRVNTQIDVGKYRTALHPLHDYSYKNLSNSLLLWYDNQRNKKKIKIKKPTNDCVVRPFHDFTLYKMSYV